MEGTIKVFQVNDCEWWVGTDLESIGAAYKYQTGIDPEDEDDGGFSDPRELTEAEMNRMKYSDSEHYPETTRTFTEQLAKMIADGEKFPCMFATTEY